MQTEALEAALRDPVNGLSSVLACFPYFFKREGGCCEVLPGLCECEMIVPGHPKLGSESRASSQMVTQ